MCACRYAVLAGLCFTPELYCCGVDVVGPSHVLTLFQSIPPYWAPIKKQLIDRVGDVENDDEINRKISPLYHVDKITCACPCKPPCCAVLVCRMQHLLCGVFMKGWEVLKLFKVLLK